MQSASQTSLSPMAAPPPAPPHSPRTSQEPPPRYQTQTADRSYAATSAPETAPSSRSGTPRYAPGFADRPHVCPPQLTVPATLETQQRPPRPHAPHLSPDRSPGTSE